MAYPGDPLRFHSHFLAVGRHWEEEWELGELVSGGRLGTGVKKGFLIGGEVTTDGEKHHRDQDSEDKITALEVDDDKKGVRAFCVEWGGM